MLYSLRSPALKQNAPIAQCGLYATGILVEWWTLTDHTIRINGPEQALREVAQPSYLGACSCLLCV
jgi:hypothetical protein